MSGDTENTSTWNAQHRDTRVPSGLRPGRVLAGRFRLLRVLGEGGTGVVYAALDELVGGEVAVKVLHPHLDDPGSRGRLRREVRTTRTPHPNLVTVHDLHRDGDLWFLSMELVRGETLRDRLEREGRLPVAEAIRIGREVAGALAHLHRLGIVHRDVKPGNVLLEEGTGRARLCDAGLARPLAHGETVTEARMVVGTPAYMAPEQATGGELTPATDVYALGMTLLRALTGEVPLRDATALSTLMLRQRRTPPSARRTCPEVPRWLDRLLRRMTDPDPGERPAAAAVARALERRRWRALPRRRRLAAAAAVAAAVAAAAGGWAWWRAAVPLRVEVDARGVRGVDSRGRTAWAIPLASQEVRFERADLDGDGEPETVVGSWSPADPAGSGRVLAVDRSGRVLTDVRLADLVDRWGFPYRPELVPSVVLGDLDGDGGPEVVVAARHRTYYPSVLFAWWPRRDRWERLIEHSGHIYSLHVLPAPGGARIAFLAVNNRLGMQWYLGVVRVLGPPGGDGTLAGAGWVAMFTGRGLTRDSARLHTVAYVPLGESWRGSWGKVGLEPRPGGGFRVLGGPRPLAVDRFFNPVPGPNAGRDLRALRLEAMARLVKLLVPGRGPASAPAAASRIEAARASLGPLLREAPYRALLAERGARLLARVAGPGPALELLAPATEELATDELRYLEAHLLAVAGRLEAAGRAVDRLRDDPHTVRGVFDAQLLALRLAIERRDPAGLERELARFGNELRPVYEGSGDLAALRARAHLWWDRIEPADLEVASGTYTPDGDAVAILCRWRAGRLRPDDLEAAGRAIRDHPDAAAEGRLAAAAAELGLGRPGEAHRRLAALTPALAELARDDFFFRQLLDLARALEAEAALEAGDPDTARRLARAALPELAPGLLPSRILREVLAAVGEG